MRQRCERQHAAPPASPRLGASRQQQKTITAGTTPPSSNDEPRQLRGMLAGDAKTHFAGQIVLVDMRPLEQAHAADEAEARGGFGRRQRLRLGHAAATTAIFGDPGRNC